MAPNKKDDKAGKKDPEGSLKRMLKRYIAMFPLVRSDELGKIITEPDKEMPNEIAKATVGQGLSDAIITSMIFTFVLSAFYLVFSIPTLMPLLKMIPDTIIMMVLGVIVMSVAFGAMSAFVGILLTSIGYIIMTKILGGKGTFAKTMGMLGIISAPINLINIALVVIAGIIAFVGMVLAGALWPALWSVLYTLVLLAGIGICLFQLYLNYKMVRLLHQLSKWRAITVVVISGIVVAALVYWVVKLAAAAALIVL